MGDEVSEEPVEETFLRCALNSRVFFVSSFLCFVVELLLLLFNDSKYFSISVGASFDVVNVFTSSKFSLLSMLLMVVELDRGIELSKCVLRLLS